MAVVPCLYCNGTGNRGGTTCQYCRGSREKEILCGVCRGSGFVEAAEIPERLRQAQREEQERRARVAAELANAGNTKSRSKCKQCNGTGRFKGRNIEGDVCDGCMGTGEEPVKSDVVLCTSCKGQGSLDCPTCHGERSMTEVQFKKLTGRSVPTAEELRSDHTIRCITCEGIGRLPCNRCRGYRFLNPDGTIYHPR